MNQAGQPLGRKQSLTLGGLDALADSLLGGGLIPIGLLLSATDLEPLLGEACKSMAEQGYYGYSWICLLHAGVVDTVFTADDSVRFPESPPYDPFNPADPCSSSPAAQKPDGAAPLLLFFQ